MKNKLIKLGVSMLLFATMLLPNTIAMAADEEETSWTTMASMSAPRYYEQTEIINGKIYVLGGIAGSARLSSLEVYDPSTNKWSKLASMATSRSHFQTEVIDSKIYAIGGHDGSSGLASIEVYNPSSDTWTTLASMSTPRYHLQTEVIDGKIYAIGGYDGSTFLASVEVYDPSSDTWTTCNPMSTPRNLHQTEVIDGKIYVLGGRNNAIKSLLEVYDPSSDTWTTLAPMSTPRYYFQTEVIRGKIYAIGGLNGSIALSSAEVYDPSTNTWASLPSMSTPRAFFQTEMADGKIYAIGGINGPTGTGTALPSAEVYNPSSDTWVTLASMSAPRNNFQTEVINGIIYSIGGYSVSSSLNSMEAYTVPFSPSAIKLKVVLEINENLQLSVDDNLSENAKFTWSTSNSSVASVDENGMVTALATGNTVITVSDGASYSESINVLVVENADTYRLAIDLNVGNTSRLTVDDYTNTANATWVSSDPAIATITNAGRVTAVNAGLTLITATDVDKNQIGQAYVRVRA